MPDAGGLRGPPHDESSHAAFLAAGSRAVDAVIAAFAAIARAPGPVFRLCHLGFDLSRHSRGTGKLAALPARRAALRYRRRRALRMAAHARGAIPEPHAMDQRRDHRHVAAGVWQWPGLL